MAKFDVVVKHNSRTWGDPRMVMGDVMNALRKAGASREQVDEFLTEAMSGDADNVLRTAMKWVQVA